jgi:uncharacterized protein
METVLGKFMWADLTVDDAIGLRDFYCAVGGWTWEAVAMGDYDDYIMKNANGDVVSGICHHRGVNNKIPPHWINYLTVASVNESATNCEKSGGKLIDGPRKMGEDVYLLIQDPAGAYIALYGKP